MEIIIGVNPDSLDNDAFALGSNLGDRRAHLDDGIAAIGSGGSYALAAARALLRHTGLGAREIASEALRVAGEICIYTNDNISIEEL